MNRLLKRGILWVMIFPLFLLGSCGGDDEMNPEPSVDAEITFTEESQSYVSGGMTFEAAADSKTVHFTTNQAWDVEVASGEWCTVSPASGSAGSGSFTVSVTENTEDADRSTSITLTAGTASQTLQVTQTSASFDVEEVSSYITEVTGVVDELFMQSEGIEDLSQHEDDIRALEGVETVEITDLELAVKIKNGGFISWYYPPQQEIAAANNQVNLLQGFSQSVFASTRGLATDHEFIDAKSICIINQTANDEKFEGAADAFSQLESYLAPLFNVELVRGEAANLNFFASLTGYDYIFMETHGGYSNGLHWLSTGETVAGTPETWLKERWGSQWRRGSFGIMKLKETRDSKETEISYWAVNENFIQSLQGSFNRSIIFNVACQSLKGTNALANAFQKKGAGVYIGYDETNAVGAAAGINVLGYLSMGMTVGQAVDSLPANYRADANWGGTLRYYPQSGEHLCILHPEVQTLEATDITGNTAKVHGTITQWSETFDTSNSQAGFCWSSTNPEPTIESGKSKSESVELFPNDGTSISINGDMFNLRPNTTYYYRAFLYMNGDYYYGDVKEVKTTEQEDDGMRDFLVKLYHDTDGDNWTRNDNWLSDKPITEWYGVTKYDGLYYVSLENNNLIGNVDFEGCQTLNTLLLDYNNIANINTADCVNLRQLNCIYASLENVNVSRCINLETLFCSGSDLKSIIAPNCPNLVSISYDHHYFENTLEYVDITNDKKLTNNHGEYMGTIKTEASGSGITYAEIASSQVYANFSGCQSLTEIRGGSDYLEYFNIKGCSNLETFHVSFPYSYSETTFDFSEFTKLKELTFSGYGFSHIDFSKCSELVTLRIDGVNVDNINASGLPNLEDMEIYNTWSNYLNVSNCGNLKRLVTQYCYFKGMDLSNCGNLIDMRCLDNDAEIQLDITECHPNMHFYWGYSKLTQLRLLESQSKTGETWGDIDSDLYPFPSHMNWQQYPEFIYE